MEIREPAVAGRFYPGTPELLGQEVRRYLGDRTQAATALGAVVPHAGYVYSGRVAGETFARLRIPSRAIVIAPNHTGRGAEVSVVARGSFRIPGAMVPIDEALAQCVLEEVPGAKHDVRAHTNEHAVEVELPFLHALNPKVQIVPIVLGWLDEHQVVAVGRGLARAVERCHLEDDVLVIASSDMSHYLDDGEARRRDRMALGPLLERNPESLVRTCREQDISMCGVLPTAAMLAYANARGATRAELVGYATSGDVSGDRDRVVGYAGVIVR